jgi:hypothetical protein
MKKDAAGNVAINTAVPGDAPTGSLAVAGTVYADALVTSGASASTLNAVAAPAGNPPNDKVYFWPDTTDRVLKIKDQDGNVSVTPKTGNCPVLGQFVRGYATDGSATCDTPSSSYDPTDTSQILIRDDFVNGNATVSGSNLGTEQAWAFSRYGTAAATVSLPAAVANRPGLVRCTTSNANADNGCYFALASVLENFGSGGAFATWTETWVFRLGTITNLTFRIGSVGAVTAVTPANFIGLRFIAGTDTYWTFDSRSGCTGGTEACAAETISTGSTNIAPNGSNWIKLTMTSSGGGNIVFTLRDLTAGTSTTYTNSASNVPTAALGPWMGVQQSAAQYTTVDMDYFLFRATGITR